MSRSTVTPEAPEATPASAAAAALTAAASARSVAPPSFYRVADLDVDITVVMVVGFRNDVRGNPIVPYGGTLAPAVPRPAVPAGFARVLVPRMAETGVVKPPPGALKLLKRGPSAVVKAPPVPPTSWAEYVDAGRPPQS